MDAQDGDARAMDELVHRWQKRLWAHAYRMVRDEEGAWDVMQQSWLGIVRGLRSLHDPASFRAWAYRIVTNMAARWVNQRAKLGEQIDIDKIEVRQKQRNDESGIEELMQKLDADRRMVLGLFYFDELSVSEISHVLDVPAGTVKSRLYSAREELRRLWEESLAR